MAGNKKPMGVNFEKILRSLQGDVENMKTEYNESGLPINDDSTHLHQFCERLEFFLTSGLRERGGLLGGRRDVWHYVCRCLADRRNIHDGLRVVKANTELKTGVGRARCLVRYCLVHGCLGDVVQQCVENKAATRQCYQDGAPLLHPTLAPALYSALYNLSELKFDLPPSGYDLDMAWPAFTRGGLGSWRPPSRTMSVSSLFSQVSEAPSLQSPIHTNMMGPLGEMDDPTAPADGPPGVVEDVASLHSRLVQLEEENTSLRASCTHLQQKLDEALETSAAAAAPNEAVKEDVSECSRCEVLSGELAASREECNELRRLQQVLESQVEALQIQVDECHTQENKLKAEIKTLEETAAENRLVKPDTQSLSHSPPASTASEQEKSHQLDGQNSQNTPTIATMEEQKQTQDSSAERSQDMLDQCRRKLEDVEKENKALKEQFKAAEIEKTTLRTNIRKIIEAEERLKQKVESLSQREKEYETLQEEIEQLQEKYEERGNLLHVATDRVKELESALQTHQNSSEDTTTKLRQANDQIRELKSLHEELNSEYRQLKEEMINLQQQLTDLRFQLSSKDMEHQAAVQADQEKKEALTAAMSQISQNEEEISDLKQQLASEKHESECQRGQVGELTQTLGELQKIEMNLKEAQESLSETQKELSSSKEESSQLTQDNEQLREKIIQLLREKDALWQAKMRLEAAAGGGREWMQDKSANACMGCQAAFSLTRRRHHCRACGRIFCTGCSDNWIMTSASSRRVRVCDDCFSVQAELAAIVASPTISTSTTQHREQGSETENTVLPSTSGPLPIATSQPNDDDYAMISDEELQTSRMSSSPSSGSPPSNTSETTETRATLDIISFATLSTSPPTDAEVWVGAGTRVLVPVELPAGVSLHWKFISEPKSVSFAVLHQPPPESSTMHEDEAEGSSSESRQRVLIPTTRVASAQGSAIRGKLLSKQPGVYTLVFDNSCSRFTAKKVTYNLSLETPPGQSPSTTQSSSSPSVS